MPGDGDSSELAWRHPDKNGETAATVAAPAGYVNDRGDGCKWAVNLSIHHKRGPSTDSNEGKLDFWQGLC